eukprot:m.224832 g.224832  ORF g.224832 m.224832 type:complete len:167 (-) comp16555_c0_seq1:100-600(-)
MVGKFIAAGAGIVAVIFYIIACATQNWTTYNVTSIGDMRLSPFKTKYGNYGDYVGCDMPSVFAAMKSSSCDKLRVTAAFTIMALIIAAAAAALGFLNKGKIAGAALVVSGLFGMIGWAVWYSLIDSDVQSGVNDYKKIDYSQALVITAWTTSIVFGAAGAVLSKDA